MKSPKTEVEGNGGGYVELESRFEVLEVFERIASKSSPRTPNQRIRTLKHGHKTRKQSSVHTTCRWQVAPPIHEGDRGDRICGEGQNAER
ncbi:hypothetical protein DVH24_018656 [Malus domestica]|uniref:Uncharacterized protein n=1 Tax=Malus domestica TaxID=3750 RepID=A0A498HQ56_MALDO|nr:hypothetical protein DVH24_018656 [Malus domestica]